MMFACSIDETQQGQDEPEVPACLTSRTDGVRSEVMNSYGLWAFHEHWMRKQLNRLAIFLQYADLHPGRKRRIPVNVGETVARWTNAIASFCMAHDKDALDKTEAAVEDLLTPMLQAPVKQLREFYAQLVQALKDDQRIPFFAWRAFEIWHLQVVKNAPDEEAKELKKDLAAAIATIVEQDVRDDWHPAIIDALMWRSEERLQRMHEALSAAKEKAKDWDEEVTGKPAPRARVKGRESCLFLQIETEPGKVDEVML